MGKHYHENSAKHRRLQKGMLNSGSCLRTEHPSDLVLSNRRFSHRPYTLNAYRKDSSDKPQKYGAKSTTSPGNRTETSEWMQQIRELTSTLALELSGTLAVSRRFLEIQPNDFDFGSTESRQALFFNIEDHVENLNNMHTKLQGLVVLHREISDTVSKLLRCPILSRH